LDVRCLIQPFRPLKKCHFLATGITRLSTPTGMFYSLVPPGSRLLVQVLVDDNDDIIIFIHFHYQIPNAPASYCKSVMRRLYLSFAVMTNR